MRITILHGGCFPIPPLLGGAVEKIWFALAREFARQGHRVVQVSRTFAGLPKRQLLDGVEHRRLEGYQRPLSFSELFLRELLFSFRALSELPCADIIVTHSITAPLLIRKARLGRLYVHAARFPKGQLRWYRHARRLQTVSQTVADAMIAQAPELAHLVHVIPNPHIQEDIRLNPLPKREPVLLFAGRVHPEKGVHLLCEAFLALPSSLRDLWRLLIAGSADASHGGGGPAYEQRLQSLAARSGDRIRLIGHVADDHELARLYASARLFVYPSLAATGETFGAAPLEALYWGCPVLVSHLPCFREFLRESVNGWSVHCTEEFGYATLSGKLSELLSHPELLEAASAAARETTDRFSLSRISALYLEDFTRIMQTA